jgi:hypothetical protein
MVFKIIFVLGFISLGLLLTNSHQNINAQTTGSVNYTFNMNLKQSKFSPANSPMFDVASVDTNVTDLSGSSIAKGLGFPVSVSEDQVFFDFTLKIPEAPGSKKSVLEKSSFFLSVSSIEEKEKRTKTYELQPQQFNDAVIGGHNVLGGTLDLQGTKGIVHLNLQSTK